MIKSNLELRAYLKKNNIKQKELIKSTGRTGVTIGRLLSGKSHNTYFEVMQAVDDILKERQETKE